MKEKAFIITCLKQVYSRTLSHLQQVKVSRHVRAAPTHTQTHTETLHHTHGAQVQRGKRLASGPFQTKEKKTRRDSQTGAASQSTAHPEAHGRAAAHYFEFFKVTQSQSSPSYSPSPVVAHVAWMYHLRLRMFCRPSVSVMSAAFMALGRSWERQARKNVHHWHLKTQ